MTEPNYEAFYEAIIDIAEDLQTLVEVDETITPSERTILSVCALNIVFAAEEHVPGGLHTQVFNINHKED